MRQTDGVDDFSACESQAPIIIYMLYLAREGYGKGIVLLELVRSCNVVHMHSCVWMMALSVTLSVTPPLFHHNRTV